MTGVPLSGITQRIMKHLFVLLLAIGTGQSLWALPPTSEINPSCPAMLSGSFAEEEWVSVEASGSDEDPTTLWGALRGGNNMRYIGPHTIQVSNTRRYLVKFSEYPDRLRQNLALEISWDAQNGSPTVLIYRDEEPAVAFEPGDFSNVASILFRLNPSGKAKKLQILELTLSRSPLELTLVTGTKHIQHLFGVRSPILVGLFQH